MTSPFDEGLLHQFTNLYDGQRSSANELEDLRQVAQQIEQVKQHVLSWVSPGVVTFNRVEAQETFFRTMPNNFIVMDKVVPTAINHDTVTLISGYDPYAPVTGERPSATNDFFSVDETNGRIYILQPTRMYGFYILNHWANGSGYRSARVYAYNADGTEIGYSFAYRHVATTSLTSVSTTIFVPWGGSRGIGDYVRMSVYQNSGGTIDLDQCALGAFVIR
jgi:hypothetical protein